MIKQIELDEITHEMKQLFVPYSNEYQQIFLDICTFADKVEYGKGGEMMHRGFYCPSPILDLVTGNISRGHIQSLTVDNSDVSYEYFFKGNDLYAVIKHHNQEKCINANEVIMFHKEFTFSIGFNELSDIDYLCLCRFKNKRIISYAVLNAPFIHAGSFLNIEKYQYSDNLLIQATSVEYLPFNKITTQNNYYFEFDSEGYFQSYSCQELSSLKEIQDNNEESHRYAIKIKRKSF